LNVSCRAALDGAYSETCLTDHIRGREQRGGPSLIGPAEKALLHSVRAYYPTRYHPTFSVSLRYGFRFGETIDNAAVILNKKCPIGPQPKTILPKGSK
jgi:hypothetical protein